MVKIGRWVRELESDALIICGGDWFGKVGQVYVNAKEFIEAGRLKDGDQVVTRTLKLKKRVILNVLTQDCMKNSFSF